MSSQFKDIPIYRKALEIRRLTASISHYLRDDLCQLKEDGSEDQHIYFSGDIVQQSSALGSEILNVEKNKLYYHKKHYHIKALHRLTGLLYKNTKRLKRSNSNGRDYLTLLERELKAFASLQRTWMLTL